MTDNGANSPRYDDLVGEVRYFANQQARPRLTAQEVRRRGLRRRRTRQSATALGGGALAVAGIVIGVLLTGGQGRTVVPPANRHPVPAPTTATSTPPQPAASAAPVGGSASTVRVRPPEASAGSLTNSGHQ